MTQKQDFVHKILTHLSRLDKSTIHGYVLNLSETNLLYREVIDELEEGIVVIDEQNHVRLLNRQAIFYLAVKGDFSHKLSIFDLIRDNELSQFIASHVKDLTTKVVQDLPIMIPRQAFIRVTLTPLPPGNVLILFSNITAEKGRTTDYERTQRIEALVRLTAGLAHEIGNPLNSLAIHLDLLRETVRELPSSKQAKFSKTLEVVRAETARLDKIVRDFLKATRKPLLRFKTEDLNEIIAEAVRVMEPEFKMLRMSVKFEQDAKLPPFLIDRERLYQSFINLIKNSKEAMAAGGKLQISITHKENVASIRFRDNGCGISPKDLPHIFEPYFTTKSEGSGLGLMTVHQAVADHGGKIEVSSRPNKGTLASIFLPIRFACLQLPDATKPHSTSKSL